MGEPQFVPHRSHELRHRLGRFRGHHDGVDRASPGEGPPAWVRRAVAGSLLVVIGLLAAPGTAEASLGVGVGARPLTAAFPAHPGAAGGLTPDLLVVNTGTETAHCVLTVKPLNDSGGKTLPAAWVTFAAADFVLAPGERRTVNIRVAVPGSAQPGEYASDVVATAVIPHARPQAAAGAAAATTVTVQVSSVSAPFPWVILAAAGAGLLLIGLVLLVRRSGLRLRLERR